VKDESAEKTYSADGISMSVDVECLSHAKVGELEYRAVVVEEN
jgi:hypothetical protein